MTETLGEFGRIRRYFAPLAGPGGLGLKDDAALIDCAAGRSLVVTVDAMVEGVHYLPDDPPELVAKKLLRVNLSDLAAKGARPLHYLLTTALPGASATIGSHALRPGSPKISGNSSVDLLGGDSVSTSGPAVLSLTALGEVAAGAEIRRSGARDGRPGLGQRHDWRRPSRAEGVAGRVFAARPGRARPAGRALSAA